MGALCASACVTSGELKSQLKSQNGNKRAKTKQQLTESKMLNYHEVRKEWSAAMSQSHLRVPGSLPGTGVPVTGELEAALEADLSAVHLTMVENKLTTIVGKVEDFDQCERRYGFENSPAFHPAELSDILLLGDWRIADRMANGEWTGSQIGGVVNLLRMTEAEHSHYEHQYSSRSIAFLNIPCEDSVDYPILQCLGEVVDFVWTHASEGHRVFIHCSTGVNTSPALAVGVLMKLQGWRLEAAVRHVFEQRPIVLRNEGFRRQLVEYAASEGLLEAGCGPEDWRGLFTPFSWKPPQ